MHLTERLDDRLGCIFVHNRKCAGTSVKKLVERHDPGLPERDALNDGVLDPTWQARRQELDGYVAFTVVRNPWDRFVSGWLYSGGTRNLSIEDVLGSPPQPDLWSNVFARRGSLRSRLTYGVRRVRQWSKGAGEYKRGYDYRHVTRPQHVTLLGEDERIAVDRVIYFEAIEEGLAALGNDLGVDLSHLPTRNRSAGRQRDYRTLFSDRARELFEMRYARDIELWGYDFDSGLPEVLR